MHQISTGAKSPIRVEAAAWRGRPVYFHVIGSWARPEGMQARRYTTGERANQVSAVVVIAGVLIAACLLARRGAPAAAIVALFLTAWTIGADHVRAFAELSLFAMGCWRIGQTISKRCAHRVPQTNLARLT